MTSDNVNAIDIWAPRFKDKYGATRSPVALIAPFRVTHGMNLVYFTKTMKNWRGLMSGERIKSYPMESNGSIGCYVVPLKDFEMEETKQTRLGLEEKKL